MSHKTVLLHEAVDGLQFNPEDIVVDATFGSGGHAREILRCLNKDGVYVGIDADATAFAGKSLTVTEATVHLVNDNFKNIAEIVRSLHIEKVDAILADLGWRMEQFADGGKGFSFNKDEPLHMTFGDPKEYPFTAHDIVNDWDEETLANIFYGYAEERFSRRIARAIVEARKENIIASTKDLVTIIENAVPAAYRHKRVHPATKSFQALRIAVNDELGVLETFISQAMICLEVGGRLGIITFHSIEDRIVKQTFRSLAQANRGMLVTKKPITPSAEELAENPRARSAKLRIIEKI
jgi:16S rRNA (cytosine1402-N4)-methyltransferase